jgi:transcriptional repressor NrdR
VTSSAIGEEVMAELRAIDEVAYVRFASVYRHFKDASQFMDEVQSLRGGGNPSTGERMPEDPEPDPAAS